MTDRIQPIIKNVMRPDPITNVSSKYGAPMGRRDDMHPSYEGKVHLAHVALNSGGYDAGGAYWGIGARLYVAWGYDGEEYRVDTFTRARDRNEAKSQILERYPEVTFYR